MLSGKLRSFTFVSEKATRPIVFTVSGKVITCNPLLQNASSAISSKADPSSKSTVIKLSQYPKAPFPIYFNPLGNVIYSIPL